MVGNLAYLKHLLIGKVKSFAHKTRHFVQKCPEILIVIIELIDHNIIIRKKWTMIVLRQHTLKPVALVALQLLFIRKIYIATFAGRKMIRPASRHRIQYAHGLVFLITAQRTCSITKASVWLKGSVCLSYLHGPDTQRKHRPSLSGAHTSQFHLRIAVNEHSVLVVLTDFGKLVV